MTASDTSERGLERLICTALTGSPCDPGDGSPDEIHERPAVYGAGWICGAAEPIDGTDALNDADEDVVNDLGATPEEIEA